MDAASQAEGEYALEEAEAHYRIALDLARRVRDQDGAAEVLHRLGTVLYKRASHSEALQVLEQAAEYYRFRHEKPREALVVAQIGRVHADRGTPGDAIPRVQALVDVLEEEDASPALARIYTAFASLYFASGRYVDQLDAANRAYELGTMLDDLEIQADAQYSRGVALSLLGRHDEGREPMERAAALAERIRDYPLLRRALSGLAAWHEAAGDFHRCKIYRERALEAATRTGNPAWIGFALSALAGVLYNLGYWDDAQHFYVRSLEDRAATGTSRFTPYSLCGLGRILLYRGETEEAARLLEEARAIAELSNDLQAMRIVQRDLADFDLLSGYPDVACARLEPLLDRGDDEEEHVTNLLPTFATALVESGQEARAAKILDECIRRAMEQESRAFLLQALTVQGHLEACRRRWDIAVESFEHALGVSQTVSQPFRKAQLLLAYGTMHVQKGDLEPARARLESARAIFQELGARPFLERIQQMFPLPSFAGPSEP
jgi:tetratricopeptide (TPR) repeat protein